MPPYCETHGKHHTIEECNAVKRATLSLHREKEAARKAVERHAQAEKVADAAILAALDEHGLIPEEGEAPYEAFGWALDDSLTAEAIRDLAVRAALAGMEAAR